MRDWYLLRLEIDRHVKECRHCMKAMMEHVEKYGISKASPSILCDTGRFYVVKMRKMKSKV